jgi:hypothetical protein
MKIEVLGASTSAKRSRAGNQYVGKGTVTIGMEGGVARLRLAIEGKDSGDAIFRLTKDQAFELIQNLKKLYNLGETA